MKKTVEQIREERKTDPEELRVRSFLEEYVTLCEKHDLCLSHQDYHGAFEVHPANDSELEWAVAARAYLGT